MSTPSELPRATLITYWCEGVYGYRKIIHGSSAETYVKDVAETISRGIQELVRHHGGDVTASELDILQEDYGNQTESEPDNLWDYENVLELLKTLPAIALTEYTETGALGVAVSDWYQRLIGFLNDQFPHGDAVWVNFEGSLGEFLSELINFEAQGCKSIERLSDASAIWLGKVAVLSQLSWQGEVSREQHQALFKVVKEFNDDNAEIYSLK